MALNFENLCQGLSWGRCPRPQTWPSRSSTAAATAHSSSRSSPKIICSGTDSKKVRTLYSKYSRALTFENVLESRGADLQWLSAFPNESEVLFPPLTYMQPTGKMQVIKMQGYTVLCGITEAEFSSENAMMRFSELNSALWYHGYQTLTK